MNIYAYEVKKTVNKETVTELVQVGIEEGMSFHGEPLDEEKEIRRLLDLPLTKPLVIKKRMIYPEWETYKVEKVTFYKLFSDWFILDVDGTRIHSAFFAHMQKPSFEADIKRAEKEIDG